MKIFVVNCGSSSIKYTLFRMTTERVAAKGVLERIGPDARLKHTVGEQTTERHVDALDHTSGLKIILEMLVDPDVGVLEDIRQIEGVGHRVVHGGERITEPSRIDDEVISIIRDNFPLAPLHNPANLAGIEAAMEVLPDIPHVAAFDTAFLSTMPPHAFRYAVPTTWYTEHFVRRYGFHGTSHQYVSLQTADLLGIPHDQVHLITCHLGNGCSATAIAGGKAVDHSMGMTPLEGLVMGTRCGDIDPAISYYMQQRGLSNDEINDALNKRSGLLGVSEQSNDMRDLLASAAKGSKKSDLAIDMFVYRVVKYIGAYYAILPRVDAVVLTGGIGENSVGVRARLLDLLRRYGSHPDAAANEQTVHGRVGEITRPGAPLPVWVVPTNEELMIARDTLELVRTPVH